MRALAAATDERDLPRRAVDALARASANFLRSALIRARAEESREEARLAREMALRSRAASRPFDCYARIEGWIGDDPVFGVVRRDGTVVAHELLVTRADLLARLGETFVDPNGGVHPASLGMGAFVATLTMIRACDRATTVDLWASGRRS